MCPLSAIPWKYGAKVMTIHKLLMYSSLFVFLFFLMFFKRDVKTKECVHFF